MTREIKLGKWTKVVILDTGPMVFAQRVIIDGKKEEQFLLLNKNEAKKLKKVM